VNGRPCSVWVGNRPPILARREEIEITSDNQDETRGIRLGGDDVIMKSGSKVGSINTSKIMIMNIPMYNSTRGGVTRVFHPECTTNNGSFRVEAVNRRAVLLDNSNNTALIRVVHEGRKDVEGCIRTWDRCSERCLQAMNLLQ